MMISSQGFVKLHNFLQPEIINKLTSSMLQLKRRGIGFYSNNYQTYSWKMIPMVVLVVKDLNTTVVIKLKPTSYTSKIIKIDTSSSYRIE